MENGGNIFSNGNRGQNGNSNHAWNIWDFGTTTRSAITSNDTTITTSALSLQEASVPHALMFDPHHSNHHYYNDGSYQQQLSGDGRSHMRLDPPSHVMCLKLGKRQYFENSGTVGSCSGVGNRHVSVTGFYDGKKGRPYHDGGGTDAWGNTSSSPPVVGVPVTGIAVARCQVDGCEVGLVNAKEYHRRHKVCEMHSKAPKVVVLGLEQRFCQQCSRFHAICEFDETKRSCRRRLAGHNERRRKSSHDSVVKNPSQENKLTAGRYSYIASPTERAHSLLSSNTDHHSWVSPPDLSSRSSAALRELIAENRAAILAGQLVLDRDWHWHHHTTEDLSSAQAGHGQHHQHQMYHDPPSLDRYHGSGSHITLDLMQAPSSDFGFLSVREKSNEEVEECSELWMSLEGAHVV